MKLIEAQKIRVSFDGSEILQDVDLELRKGEVLGLIGPNGAGKSTLLKVLMGEVTPASGSVRILDGKREHLAKRVAYLPQGQVIHWPLSVKRLVSLGRIPHLMPWESLGPEDEKAIAQAMEDTDVAHLKDRFVDHLAGGERNLVLLARALATQPSVLLADEPVQGLDPAHGLQVMELLSRFVNHERGAIVVLHDLTLAARFCHRLVLLHEGKVLASGKPEEVLSPENLRKSYHVEAKYGSGNDFYVVPWKTVQDVRRQK
ncbi:MAG: ABC transporter ATP-binding protein [Candidatus Omnitrophota bacterium]